MTDKRPSGYGAVLRNRDFFILWSGSLVSSLGDALRNIALLWLVKELTGSNLAMGTVMLFSMLPYVLLGLFAGSVVDLADRKKIMVWSDIIRGGLSLSVPLLLATGHLAFWHLCAMAFLMSSVSAFFQPAMQASIPNVVGRDHLMTANALGSLTFQISGIVGPALGGAIVGLAGTQPAFIADGVSFLISAMAILLARIPGAQPAAGQPRPNVARVLSGVKEGFVFIAARRLLLTIVVMALVVNFFTSPIMVLMANHVDTAWHAGAQGYGLLGSALSLGALVSTLVLGAVAARFKAQRLAVAGLAAMGLGTLALVPASRLEHGIVIFLALGLPTRWSISHSPPGSRNGPRTGCAGESSPPCRSGRWRPLLWPWAWPDGRATSSGPGASSPWPAWSWWPGRCFWSGRSGSTGATWKSWRPSPAARPRPGLRVRRRRSSRRVLRRRRGRPQGRKRRPRPRRPRRPGS